ncbi:hypothetical protein [Helicobacter sp. T3_23-1059]
MISIVELVSIVALLVITPVSLCYGDKWVKWLIKARLLKQEIDNKSNVLRLFLASIIVLLPIIGAFLITFTQIGLLVYKLNNPSFIVRLFFVVEEYIFKRGCLLVIVLVVVSPFFALGEFVGFIVMFICGGLFYYYMCWWLCIGSSQTLANNKNTRDYKIIKVMSYIFVVCYVLCWIIVAIFVSFEKTESFMFCMVGIFLFLFAPIALRSFVRKMCFDILEAQNRQTSQG